MIRVVRFAIHRDVADYGFDGSKPIRQDEGYLLPWIAIDAERERRLNGGPCEFVVVGEYVDDERRRSSPILEINPDWMAAKGYSRSSYIEHGKVKYTPWKHRDAA